MGASRDAAWLGSQPGSSRCHRVGPQPAALRADPRATGARGTRAGRASGDRCRSHPSRGARGGRASPTAGCRGGSRRARACRGARTCRCGPSGRRARPGARRGRSRLRLAAGRATGRRGRGRDREGSRRIGEATSSSSSRARPSGLQTRGDRPSTGAALRSRRRGRRRGCRRAACGPRRRPAPPALGRRRGPRGWRPRGRRTGGPPLARRRRGTVGRRQRLDRFQDRTCTAGAVRGIAGRLERGVRPRQVLGGTTGARPRGAERLVWVPRAIPRADGDVHVIVHLREVRDGSARAQTRCCSPVSNRRMTTSMSWARRAPTTTGPASCHHGTSTSNGARAPRIAPVRAGTARGSPLGSRPSASPWPSPCRGGRRRAPYKPRGVRSGPRAKRRRLRTGGSLPMVAIVAGQ